MTPPTDSTGDTTTAARAPTCAERGSLPRVSVIISTYSRSNVLRLAIESARRSTLEDIEILVVDDASPDDTAAVVAAIDDPRIRYLRLDENFGEQSGPNNVGWRAARAPWVAFLNHDDLYFADHLERCLQTLEETGADLVFALGAGLLPLSPEAVAAGGFDVRERGGCNGGHYAPHVIAPASLWVLRRSMCEALGGFRPATELVILSSQDFLHRAWRAGYDLRRAAHLGVVIVASGSRENCYKDRVSWEHEHYAERVFHEPGFREALLSAIAIRLAGREAKPWGRLAKKLRRHLYDALGRWLRVHPQLLEFHARGIRRGDLIRTLRRGRGLNEHAPSGASQGCESRPEPRISA